MVGEYLMRYGALIHALLGIAVFGFFAYGMAVINGRDPGQKLWFGFLFSPPDRATLLRALAVHLERGATIRQAMTQIIDAFSDQWPLDEVNRRMEQGTAWYAALRDCRLIRKADAAVLESAQRAGNLAWALRAMADSNDRQFIHRLRGRAQLLTPLAILCVGGAVGFFIISYFLPLLYLLRSASEW
jgi:type II secretory pathway component PulF